MTTSREFFEILKYSSDITIGWSDLPGLEEASRFNDFSALDAAAIIAAHHDLDCLDESVGDFYATEAEARAAAAEFLKDLHSGFYVGKRDGQCGDICFWSTYLEIVRIVADGDENGTFEEIYDEHMSTGFSAYDSIGFLVPPMEQHSCCRRDFEKIEDSLDYHAYSRASLGFSDIAALVLVGCGNNNLKSEVLHFGGDDSYSAYVVDSRAKIGGHYQLKARFTTWLKVYDDEGLQLDLYGGVGTEFLIYRAGGYGCLIQVLGRDECFVDVYSKFANGGRFLNHRPHLWSKEVFPE